MRVPLLLTNLTGLTVLLCMSLVLMAHPVVALFADDLTPLRDLQRWVLGWPLLLTWTVTGLAFVLLRWCEPPYSPGDSAVPTAATESETPAEPAVSPEVRRVLALLGNEAVPWRASDVAPDKYNARQHGLEVTYGSYVVQIRYSVGGAGVPAGEPTLHVAVRCGDPWTQVCLTPTEVVVLRAAAHAARVRVGYQHAGAAADAIARAHTPAKGTA